MQAAINIAFRLLKKTLQIPGDKISLNSLCPKALKYAEDP